MRLLLLFLLFLLMCSPVLGQDLFVDWQTSEPTSVSIDKESVVRVKSGNSGGSGVYLGHRIVLTAAHVVKRSAASSITCSTGTYKGTATVSSTGEDVAVIVLEEDPQIQGVYVSTTSPALGDTVYGAGYDNGKRYRVYYGNITGTRRATDGYTGIARTSGPAGAMGGNSGGPMFNGQGDVVGVISTSQNARSQYGDTGWTPTADICQFLGRFFNKGCPPNGCPPNTPQPDSTPNAPDKYELPDTFVRPPAAPPKFTEEQMQSILVKVFARIDTDPMFVGPPGTPGLPGSQPEITQEVIDLIRGSLGPLIIQPAYYEGERLLPTGSPILLEFGKTSLLPPVTLEVESVSGRKTYSQGPIGGTMRTKMGKLE